MDTNEVTRLMEAAEMLPLIMIGGAMALAAGFAALMLAARRGR